MYISIYILNNLKNNLFEDMKKSTQMIGLSMDYE